MCIVAYSENHFRIVLSVKTRRVHAGSEADPNEFVVWSLLLVIVTKIDKKLTV